MRSVLAFAILCLLPRILLGGTPDTAERLVRQLDHGIWHKRIEASRKLSEMGVSARDALLEAATQHPHTELGRRATALLKALPACSTDWSRLRVQYESHVRALPEVRATDAFLKRIATRYDRNLPALLRYQEFFRDYHSALRGNQTDEEWDKRYESLVAERKSILKGMQKAIGDAGGKIIEFPRTMTAREANWRIGGYQDRYDWRVEYEKTVYRISVDEDARIQVWPEVFDQERVRFRVRNPYLADMRIGSFSLDGRSLPVVFSVRYDPFTEERDLLIRRSDARTGNPSLGFYSAVQEHWGPLMPEEEQERLMRSARCEGGF